ncbi:MAG: T9SS type A sorting domain-containing protein [Bacteroidales bacterium]|nr:T9SS type A sorting domain-containing protein [Bacteroidales bacterium]
MQQLNYDIAIIEYHYNDPFQNSFYTARQSFYGWTWFPTTYYDANMIGYYQWATWSEHDLFYQNQINTPCSFTIDYTLSGTAPDYNLNVTVTKVAEYTGEDLVLQMSLTESHIPFSWSGLSEVNHVMRLMVPDSYGSNLDFSSSNTQTVSLDFSVDASWLTENCEISLFVQDNSSKDILQGISLMLDENPPLAPPINLQANVVDDDVTLNWDAPISDDFINYKIYRDGQFLNTADETTYIDYDLSSGTYFYEVSAVYDEGESEKTDPVEVTVLATQIIDLDVGYQFSSTRIEVENPDMLLVLSGILNENLVYVRNSNGSVFRKIGPNWVNGIGDWVTTEGYLFKMAGSETLEIAGIEIDPLTSIELFEGFQFVSYLPVVAIDASVAFESILNDNLHYIRNSQGEMLRKIGPNWVNGIGNANPGQGYLIKMYADDDLVYNIPVKSTLSTKNQITTKYFIFEGGNAADPVYTIYVSGLEIGDEVAVFDGDIMVGSDVICSLNQFDNSIAVFKTLTSRTGYTEENQISIKVWDNKNQTEASCSYNFNNEYFDAYSENTFPTDDAEFSILSITKDSSIASEISGNDINVFPNPANNIINIVSEKNIVNIKILNFAGQVIFEENSNSNNVKLNSSDYPAGIYFLQINISENIITKKLTVK